MNNKELDFPIIQSKNKSKEYGGNQEWFQQIWYRQAGCASVSGANLAAFYASKDPQMSKLYIGNAVNFDQGEYLANMEVMYSYMRPGPLGYPFVHKFARKFVNFCSERGVGVKPTVLDRISNANQAFSFIKESIDLGQPIAFLLLFHRSKEFKSVSWHWMTITGYIEEDDLYGSQIILSNYGQRQLVRTASLFEVSWRNRMRMVRFEI